MGLMDSARLWAARLRYMPRRESQAYPKILGLFGRSNKFLGQNAKPTPGNLRSFSRTPYPRRAINAVKNPIAALKWELKLGNESSYLKQKADTLFACLSEPNFADNWRSWLEQIVEDMLVTGAGVSEQQIGGDKQRPLWMWPVDATTIQPLPEWDGKPNSTRFVQASNFGTGSVMGAVDAKKIDARELSYMRMNPSSESPYGYGPLEIAYMSIQRQLAVGKFAANLASNAQPQNIIFAGDMDADTLATFRGYWTHDIEGQGKVPIIGGKVAPKVEKLHPGGDEALYLKWQEFLIREIATAFGISAQNLNLEADVNRNTSETADDRDWNAAIIPAARIIEAHINRDIIQGRLGMVGVKFEFIGLDREDEAAAADIFKTQYESNCVIPAEWREERGLKPLDSPFANMTWADVQIAIKAAQGAAQVDDPALTQGKPAASKPARSTAKQPANKGKTNPGAKK